MDTPRPILLTAILANTNTGSNENIDIKKGMHNGQIRTMVS